MSVAPYRVIVISFPIVEGRQDAFADLAYQAVRAGFFYPSVARADERRGSHATNARR